MYDSSATGLRLVCRENIIRALPFIQGGQLPVVPGDRRNCLSGENRDGQVFSLKRQLPVVLGIIHRVKHAADEHFNAIGEPVDEASGTVGLADQLTGRQVFCLTS